LGKAFIERKYKTRKVQNNYFSPLQFINKVIQV